MVFAKFHHPFPDRWQNNNTKAIYSPFGFNSELFIKKNLPFKYDVSFVGGYSAYRKWLLDRLKSEGIRVEVFGRNWGKGVQWLSYPEMVDVFNQSRINLNLSNGVYNGAGYLLWALKSPKALKNIIRTKKDREQVKGRHFEINACGGFQISYFVPGLNDVYQIEKEIVCFDNPSTLTELINFYLRNENARQEIAENGYKRSQIQHKAEYYLKNLVDTISEKKSDK